MEVRQEVWAEVEAGNKDGSGGWKCCQEVEVGIEGEVRAEVKSEVGQEVCKEVSIGGSEGGWK